jgi:hypothetical protein
MPSGARGNTACTIAPKSGHNILQVGHLQKLGHLRWRLAILGTFMPPISNLTGVAGRIAVTSRHRHRSPDPAWLFVDLTALAWLFISTNTPQLSRVAPYHRNGYPAAGLPLWDWVSAVASKVKTAESPLPCPKRFPHPDLGGGSIAKG